MPQACLFQLKGDLLVHWLSLLLANALHLIAAAPGHTHTSMEFCSGFAFLSWLPAGAHIQCSLATARSLTELQC